MPKQAEAVGRASCLGMGPPAARGKDPQLTFEPKYKVKYEVKYKVKYKVKNKVTAPSVQSVRAWLL